MSENNTAPPSPGQPDAPTQSAKSPASEPARDRGIETVRGLAAILVVVFHGERVVSGVVLDPVAFFNNLVEPLRMPLFAAIAGFVYGMRPLRSGNLAPFVLGKARRLLIPITVLGVMGLGLKITPPYVESASDFMNLWRVLVYPRGGLWFPVALFLVFLVLPILERLGWLSNLVKWAITTVSAYLLSIQLLPSPDNFILLPFAVGGAAFLFPYFMIGAGLHRFSEAKAKPRGIWIVAIVFSTSLGIFILTLMNVARIPHDRTSLLSFIVGASGVSLLILLRKTVKWLAFVGTCSYSIYLFHIYFLKLTFSDLQGNSLFQTYAVILLGVTISVVGPILIQLVIVRSRILRLLFLGLR